MSLRVEKPGLHTTVQDLGRAGWRKDALAEGGAMDRYALRVANLLVGNDEGAAGLELTLVGPVLVAETDMLLAVCGAYMTPQVNGDELPMWRPFWVAAGARLSFGAAVDGCRAYVAVAGGGILTAPVLGSRSTDTRAGIGGIAGRALRAADVLPCGSRDAAPAWRAATPSWSRRNGWAAPGWFAPPVAYGGGAADGIELRAMPGAEFGRLREAARSALFRERFTVAPASDRMGVRLTGPPVEFEDVAEMLSHGVVPGTVQVPHGGAPIVLAADCQTTGGYPKAAQVITADLALLAQAKPGDIIRFREVSLSEAQRIYIALERSMTELAAGIQLRLTQNR
ncbi:5-oxoprolinase subunit C family protein [Paenibacillus mendelii]|uniref:Biotin-dependent carboxyltransferase family protein n=1 Tax=Paenibacillus mendelii TaxID=206163 RepID=A0ABV6J8Q2_9BACL|nr:biotin-dependent carboxyltransferase family protein [Paenibacillus mendelii]MCQ6559605.1 biotin-dependent carboxyltransferase family protein [Paenibacillus mendelii]